MFSKRPASSAAGDQESPRLGVVGGCGPARGLQHGAEITRCDRTCRERVRARAFRDHFVNRDFVACDVAFAIMFVLL